MLRKYTGVKSECGACGHWRRDWSKVDFYLEQRFSNEGIFVPLTLGHLAASGDISVVTNGDDIQMTPAGGGQGYC